MPGAIEALRRFRAVGHSVHIVTARAFGSRYEENTRAWLAEHHIEYDTLDFSGDKTCRPTDVFIDDLAANVDALRRAGCAAWLLDCCGFEGQADHPYLIASWAQFEQIVHEMSETGDIETVPPSWLP